jgi:hypothetical protein
MLWRTSTVPLEQQAGIVSVAISGHSAVLGCPLISPQ